MPPSGIVTKCGGEELGTVRIIGVEEAGEADPRLGGGLWEQCITAKVSEDHEVRERARQTIVELARD